MAAGLLFVYFDTSALEVRDGWVSLYPKMAAVSPIEELNSSMPASTKEGQTILLLEASTQMGNDIVASLCHPHSRRSAVRRFLGLPYPAVNGQPSRGSLYWQGPAMGR